MVSLADRIFRRNKNKNQVVAEYNPESGKIEFLPAPNEDVRKAVKSIEAGMKSYEGMKYFSGNDNLFNTLGGTSIRNGDITYSERGAAQAYTVMVAVQAAIRFYIAAIGLLDLQVLDENGEVLWDETMPYPTDGNAFEGANLVIAMRDFHQKHKHDFLASIVFSDLVYGETYTFTEANRKSQHAMLEWINPLDIEPNIQQGKILYYNFTGNTGYENIPLDSVAYRIYNRNPFNDLRGQSLVLSAIDAINIERNTKRAISGYFQNGMILGGVVSNASDDHLAPQELDKMRTEMRRGNSGVGNAFSWVFTPVKMNVETFSADDMSKHYEIIKATRSEILMAFSVPAELVGDSDTLSYENAEPVMRNWLKVQGRDYANSQLRYLNDSLLPKFAPDGKVKFAYDFTPIDRRDAALVHADLNSGIIHLGDAARERGVEVDSDIDKAKIFMLNGVPYSQERLLAIASGEVVSTTVKPDGSSTTSGGENNAPQKLGDIPTEQVFGYHIDSGIVDINEARAQIGLKPKADKEVNELQALQAQFAVMATATSAGIPTAISSLMVGLTIPSETPPPELEAIPETQAPQFADKHVHSHELNVAKFEPAHETPLLELIAWQRVINKSHKRVFAPVHLRGDLGDIIQSGLDTANGDIQAIRAVFDAAKVALEERIKSIQSVRLDFEADFEELLVRARTENNFGRAQWSSAMRSIGRRFGKRAYSEGLIKGGVASGETNESDKNTIVQLIKAMSPHVSSLGDTLYKGDGISDSLADGKSAMWYNKSIQPFFAAGLLSADGNGIYEWARGSTEKGCVDCKRFDGQRHRLKAWERNGLMPQGDDLECNGFQCKCTLNKANARERGKF